jgi:hypothetical protein
MINFISGTIFGIIAATVGFVPIAQVFDGAMVGLQRQTIQMSAPKLPPRQDTF